MGRVTAAAESMETVVSTTKRPAHRPSRRPLILRAALEELGRVGADGGDLAAMAPIAERAGVTPAAMYYHFQSKTDLLVALLEFVEPQVEALDAGTDGMDSLEDWVREIIARFIRWVREDPAAVRFYFITGASLAAPEVHAAYDDSQHRLAQRLTASIRSLAPELDELTSWIKAMSLLALFHEVVTTSLQDRSEVSRGFHAVERAMLVLALSVVSDS